MTNTIRIFDTEYQAVVTNAPVEYDYEYCIRVFQTYLLDGDREGWFVLIPVQSVPYQSGRYFSGMYAAQLVEDFNDYRGEWEIISILHNRMKVVDCKSREE